MRDWLRPRSAWSETSPALAWLRRPIARSETTAWASAERPVRPIPDTMAACASWRNAVPLAETEVVTVSLSEIRLVTAVLEACDQVLPQFGSANWAAIVPSRKVFTCVAVRVEARGSLGGKPKAVWNAAAAAAWAFATARP